MNNCKICQKHKQETDLLIYKDAYVCVYHYLPDKIGNTNFLGYYFVEMIRHFDGIQNATDDELIAMIKITKLIATALMKIFSIPRQGQLQ